MTPPANSSVPMTLGWAGWTDVGRVRKNNEDAFLALQFDAREVRPVSYTHLRAHET